MIIRQSGPIQPLDGRRAYYVFLSHLVKSHNAGMRWPLDTVSEIGTGTHLGIGFCALLSGARRYQGFDFLPHMNAANQFSLLDELHEMFVERSPAFNDSGEKALDFPHHILSDNVLEHCLSSGSLTQIKEELGRVADEGRSDRIAYIAPYESEWRKFANSTDWLLSTATLEHIERIEDAYWIFHTMLKNNGFMSHSIDFKSHGFGLPHNGEKLWNAHWMLDGSQWRDMTIGKLYSINRLPCSEHLKITINSGFDLVLINKRIQENVLKWTDLAPQFQWMTSEDLGCSGAHIVSVKRAP